MDLHRPAARRRTDWIFQSKKQSVADDVNGVRGDFNSHGDSGNFGSIVARKIGQYNYGTVAHRVRRSSGEDEKIYAERIDAGGDDCGAGVAEYPVLIWRTGARIRS